MKRKIVFRLMAAVMMVAMILPMAAGCKNNSDDIFANPEFVFVPEFIDLPEEITDIGRAGLVYVDGKIVFTTSVYNYDEEKYIWSYMSSLNSINTDGTGFGPLPGYVAPVAIDSNVSGDFRINSIIADNDGNLWIHEQWQLSRMNVPDGVEYGTDDFWANYDQYYEDLGSGNSIRKIDSTGRELHSIDISGLSGTGNDPYDNFQISSFNVDGEGNFFLSAWTMSGMELLVLDSNGNLRFRMDNSEKWIDRFTRLADGTLAFIDWEYDYENEVNIRTLSTIDVATQTFVEVAPLTFDIWEMYPGSGEYDFIYRNNNNVFGYSIEAGEPTKLLNWLESDVSGDMIENLTILPDGRILVTNGKYNRVTYEFTYEMIILTKTPYSQLPQRTVISLATFGAWNIRDAVVQFNRSNSEYRIRVVDYQEFSTEDDWSAGLNRLTTEIISGRLPDILDVTSLPYKQYVGRGLLEDIYKLIDSDPSVNRSDFMEGAFRAAEIDGGLYQIFPSFSINTLIGNPAVVGPNIGWTMDEFKNVLIANPQADFPLGNSFTRMSFVQQAVRFSADEYINWGNGTTNFDSSNFISLLEFANTLPEDYFMDWGRNGTIASPDIDIGWGDGKGPTEDELVASNRQIMAQMWLGDFWSFQRYKQLFGDIVFKGFPTENRNGNSLNVSNCLAISSNSKNKAGAWEFLKVFLDKDWQSNNVWDFPTNKAAFDAYVERSLIQQQEQYDYWLEWYDPTDEIPPWGAWVQPPPLTQSDINQLLALIDSTSGTTTWNIDQSLLDIVSEGAEDFFNGIRTAADAARIIQSRASILVSERS